MSATIMNVIIQLIAGAIGGNAAGSSLKYYSLGGLGNSIVGALGGLGGGQILQTLIPVMMEATSGGFDISAIVGQLIGGGAGGAILTLIAGFLKNMLTGKSVS